MLSFYSASNGIVNSKKAITNCIETALKNQDSLDCNLLVIHATIGHNFQQILDQAHLLCPSARIVGCTCAGVIGQEGANENMKALAIMAIKTADSNDFCIASCDNIRGENSYEMAVGMAEELKKQNPNVSIVQILASGIDIAADRAIEGIETVLGVNTPILGGTSSDNMKAISSYQFIDTTVLERGAVLIGFADPSLEVVMGVHHGSVPVGVGFKVTKAEGNRVYEIERQPAWSYLMDQLNLPHSTHPGPCIPIAGLGELLEENLHKEYNNQHILRVIVKVDEDQSFYMPVDCKTGTRLWLTKRDETLIFDGMEQLIEEMEEKIGNKEVVAVFHTDCAARGRAMFNEINKEEIIQKMQQPIMKDQAIPWLGMYGYGEFTLLGGKNRFHNYTTSIYALLKKST